MEEIAQESYTLAGNSYIEAEQELGYAMTAEFRNCPYEGAEGHPNCPLIAVVKLQKERYLAAHATFMKTIPPYQLIVSKYRKCLDPNRILDPEVFPVFIPNE